MSQIPLDNDREGEPGKPGKPGEPGTGGGGSGGAGGAGGRGGRGGLTYHRGVVSVISRLLLLFVSVLAISLFLLYETNEKRHQQIDKIDFMGCARSQQLAENQRRITLALIELERNEQGEEHPQADMITLIRVLQLIPQFDCERGG